MPKILATCRIAGNGAAPRFRDGDYLLLMDGEPKPGEEVLLMVRGDCLDVGEVLVIDDALITIHCTGREQLRTCRREDALRIGGYSRGPLPGVQLMPAVTPGLLN